MIGILFISFFVLLFIGVPIAFSIGLSAVVALLGSDVPLNVLIPRLYSTVDSFTLMAIPFFMLVGEIMNKGGLSGKIMRFAHPLVGHIRGGMGKITILTTSIFSSISGSASAATAAVGSITIPEMIKQGYPKGYAATLQAFAGVLGPILPPSIIMIIVGSMTGLSVGKLFLAGVIPGILIAVGLIIFNYIASIKLDLPKEEKFSLKELGKSFIEAFWGLLAPIIIIGGIIGGIFTPTEAGVVASVYAFIVGKFIYKEIHWNEIGGIFRRALNSTVMVMAIAATASIFAWILANEQFPMVISDYLTNITDNPYIVILFIIIFLFIIGCFIETIAAVTIFVPVLSVIGAAYGFDPIHFAFIVAVCLILGGVSPPVGVLLFITSSIAETNAINTFKYVVPFFIAVVLIVLLITYISPLTTFLPSLIN